MSVVEEEPHKTEARPTLPPASVWLRTATMVRSGWKRAIARVRSNRFLCNAGVMSGGSAFGHVFTLAAAPILTRIYGPEEFGTLGLFTSILSIMAVAVTLQYEISIMIGSNEKEAAYLAFGSFLLTLPVSLLSGVTLWILMKKSWLGYGAMPAFSPYLLMLSLVLIGFFTTLRYWSLRAKHFTLIAQSAVIQSAARAILQTGLGFAGLHPGGLLVGETLGRGMGMSRMLRVSWSQLALNARRFQWSELRRVLGKHKKFPLYSFPSSFLDAIFLGLPLPLLVHLYGVALGGQYSLVWKAVTIPTVLIASTVADTFHSSLATHVHENPQRVMGLFRATGLGLFFVGLVPTILLISWGPSLFAWTFGSRWAMAGTIAAIIAPWYLSQFVVSPLSRVVVVLSGQETKLLWDFLCLVALGGVFLAAHKMSLPPLVTIKLLSAVCTLLFILYFLALRHILVRFDRSRDMQP